ncbi:GNAT family N-acetyltransferase [Candidatus Moduliflexota bacterium]
MLIREALESDLDDVLAVESAAFGPEEIPELVRDLTSDKSAEPLLSLLAVRDKRPVGHILFTKARLEPEAPVALSILAPLAVVPDTQRRGTGGKLVEYGLNLLRKRGVGLVFVLGHPGYYPRFGFRPAGDLGFEAAYPIPGKNADAWMVRELQDGAAERYFGKVICADTLSRPQYWRE